MKSLCPIPISLANLNNKLLCSGFVVINKPPAKKLTAADLQQVFDVTVNNLTFSCQVVDVIIVPFLKIGIWYTLPAAGMMEGEWKRQWLENNPDTTDETDLAIYFYRKT